MSADFRLLEPQALLSEHQLSHAASFGMVGMGIGKTAATLWSLHTLIVTGEITRALVIAPLRPATLSWPHEIARWPVFHDVPHYSLRRAGGLRALQERRPGLYLVNWEALPRLVALLGGDLPFDVVVFDESTKAKNPTSKRVEAFRPLLRGARARWALTGTPRPESLFDLFAQVRLLDDGARLGPSHHAFRHHYFHLANPYQRYSWKANPTAELTVAKLISDISISLRSEEWLDITPPVVEDVAVSLPPAARKIYDSMERHFIAEIRGRKTLAANAGVKMGKLLQIAGGACYVDDILGDDGPPSRVWSPVHDAKIRALQALRKQHPGEPFLIACNYRHEQERLAAVGVTRWDSATTVKQEADLLARWNAGKVPALCADPRSLGHGMNMQDAARIVVWFSPTYANENYDQLNCRLARRGQTRDVVIYRLVAEDTVDDAVLESLEEKDEGQTGLMRAIKNLCEMREN